MKPRQKHEFEEMIEGVQIPEVELEPVEIESKGTDVDYQSDYQFIRQKLYMSIIRSEEVLTEAVKGVKIAPSGRNVEAASNALANIVKNAESLIALHEKIGKMESERKKVTSSEQEDEKETKTKTNITKILEITKGA